MNEIEILDKYIKNGKVNHSYLIETNYKDRKEIANKVVDQIIEKTNSNTNLQKLLLDGDLLYIETQLQNIKKEEILDLKEKFNTSSIYNGIRIYVILEAEKLNSSSSNTLLKFLEEPNDDIYAILITSSKNKLLETIRSRCISIKINKNIIDLFEKEEDYIEFIFKFIELLENKKEKSIAHISSIIPKEYIERDKIKEIFLDFYTIYDEVLHRKYDINNENFDKYQSVIERISKTNDINELNRKMLTIDNNKNKINYNTNLKLSLYNFIIEMSGVDLND